VLGDNETRSMIDKNYTTNLLECSCSWPREYSMCPWTGMILIHGNFIPGHIIMAFERPTCGFIFMRSFTFRVLKEGKPYILEFHKNVMLKFLE
jgi:hypothetical protein